MVNLPEIRKQMLNDPSFTGDLPNIIPDPNHVTNEQFFDLYDHWKKWVLREGWMIDYNPFSFLNSYFDSIYETFKNCKYRSRHTKLAILNQLIPSDDEETNLADTLDKKYQDYLKSKL